MKKITVKKKQHISIHSYHTRKERNFIMKNLWLGWVCILTFLGNACKQECPPEDGFVIDIIHSMIIEFTFVDSVSGKDIFFGDPVTYDREISKNFRNLNLVDIIDTLKEVGFTNVFKDATLSLDSLMFNDSLIMGRKSRDIYFQRRDSIPYVTLFHSPVVSPSGANVDRIFFTVGIESTHAWNNNEYEIRVENGNRFLGILKFRVRNLSDSERKKDPVYSHYKCHGCGLNCNIELSFNDEVICSGCYYSTIYKIKI